MRFTYHRAKHLVAVLGVFGFLVVVETLGLHVALVGKHPVVAWALTAVNVASLVFLAADLVATTRRPILVSGEELVIARGLRPPVRVARGEIRSVELGAAGRLRNVGKGRPNVSIVLASGERIGFFVDEPGEFLSATRP